MEGEKVITRSVFARIVVAVAVSVAATANAQSVALDKFNTIAGAGAASAVEWFRLESTESGHRVTGEVRIRQGSVEVLLKHQLVLADDWSPLTYGLTRARGGQERSLTLTCENGRVYLRGGPGGDVAEGGGQQLAILDNAIAAHVQVLLHRRAARGGAREWRVVVPQRSSIVPGTLSEEGAAQGVLDSRPIKLQKYALEAGGQRMEIWAETGTKRLMRITEPLQSLETLREGFVPVKTAAAVPAPCEEREVSVTSGGLALPGTLCVPRGGGAKMAAVVLVHGSGSSDRDQTIGPNKPLRDLAYGLAARGIASLRYDKRTFAFPSAADMNRITLDEEVIDDAVTAVELLRGQPGIHPGQVYVVGHSLGAMLAPRIARRVEKLGGIVMLGPGARPFDEIALTQVEEQSRQAGRKEQDTREQLEKMRDFFARLRAGRAQEGETLLGAPARYWRELIAVDVPASLAEVRVPVLVLHGGKDVQVGRADYERIQAALRQRRLPLDQSEWLPEHNHLFMRFDGAATTAAYSRPGKVDPLVTGLITEWIQRCSSAEARRPV